MDGRTNQHFEQLCSNEYLSGIHDVNHQVPAEPVLDLVADSVGDKVLKLVEVDVVDEVVGEEGQAEVFLVASEFPQQPMLFKTGTQ